MLGIPAKGERPSLPLEGIEHDRFDQCPPRHRFASSVRWVSRSHVRWVAESLGRWVAGIWTRLGWLYDSDGSTFEDDRSKFFVSRATLTWIHQFFSAWKILD